MENILQKFIRMTCTLFLITTTDKLSFRDEELATEVAWVVVYLSALSEKAISLIVRSHVPQLLIARLLASENLQLLIPVLYGFLLTSFILFVLLVLSWKCLLLTMFIVVNYCPASLLVQTSINPCTVWCQFCIQCMN